ncbi:MAG: alanine racemase [Oscillospiraceae bacterium]
MNEHLKRTWCVINLDNLHYNISQIKKQIDENKKIIAVIKADAYGHGDVEVSKALLHDGIDFFAVSSLEEALSLRNNGVNCNILILGFTPVESVDFLAKYNIMQCVFSKEYAQNLNEACVKANCKVSVHLKIDTGMGRIGFIQNEKLDASKEIMKIIHLENLIFSGIFTHFSSADCLDIPSNEYTKLQTGRFNQVIEALAQKDIHFEFIHIQNSAGIAFSSKSDYANATHARAGIILYGLAPSEEKLDFSIKPVMELKSVVSMIKEVEKGTCVSYGRNFISNSVTKIATIPIGYADGFPRLLSNKGEMLIKGKRAKIIGNICMDQLMLDVTNIPNIAVGDVVTVVGADADECITFDELAQKIGTINYELVCLIGRRVPRVYKQNGKITNIVNYILPD